MVEDIYLKLGKSHRIFGGRPSSSFGVEMKSTLHVILKEIIYYGRFCVSILIHHHNGWSSALVRDT